jgi:hypothetical protein
MPFIKARVDFNHKIREWDGFGVNYVETAQTPNYSQYSQDYGGFSTLSKEQRQEIINLIFGDDGLKPGIIKMFFDPFHQTEDKQNEPGLSNICQDNYDHETSSKWTRYFAKEGLKLTRQQGRDLQIITTLYGPPGWMTKQKFVRGRDLDPKYEEECGKYMVSWVKYLKEVEGLPVKYISLHNEGEDFVRWPEDGSKDNFDEGHDYNLYWPPELVVKYLKLVRQILDANGLDDVGVTPGETSNWYRFDQWGYASAIADDEAALNSMGLITSHGFISFDDNRWFGDARSVGIDILREKRPELHTWVTSISWKKMNVDFLDDYRHSIYSVKVNGIIPWACIQVPQEWVKGDPNPGTAFIVDGKGNYEVVDGYYYYKQLCRAGQPGMAVSRVTSNDTEIGMIAFSANGTDNPDAFIVLNTSDEKKTVTISITGSLADEFEAYRTSPNEKYVALGTFKVNDGCIQYTVPAKSATTFYGTLG